MARESVQVTIDDAHLRDFAQVVRQLSSAGMLVEQELSAIGVVTGQVEAGTIDSLERVDGVAAVERTRTVSIPPGELTS